MYRLKVSKKVRKFIAKKDKKLQKRIITAFETLSKDPYENTLDIKPFISKKNNEYRLRLGSLRFIYQVIDDELLILVVDGNNRGDIY